MNTPNPWPRDASRPPRIPLSLGARAASALRIEGLDPWIRTATRRADDSLQIPYSPEIIDATTPPMTKQLDRKQLEQIDRLRLESLDESFSKREPRFRFKRGPYMWNKIEVATGEIVASRCIGCEVGCRDYFPIPDSLASDD